MMQLWFASQNTKLTPQIHLSQDPSFLGRFLSNSSFKSLCLSPFHSFRRPIRFFSADSRFDFGPISASRRTVEMHPHPSVIEFSKLLSSVVRMRQYTLALKLFDGMLKRGAPVNTYIFNIAIDCFCRPDFGFSNNAHIYNYSKRNPTLALKVQNSSNGAPKDSSRWTGNPGLGPIYCWRFLLNSSLKSLRYDSFLSISRQVRFFSANSRFDFDFGGIRGADDAVDRFQEMLSLRPRPSVNDFTRLLSIVVKMKEYSAALDMFDEMLVRNVPVDTFVFTIAIDCFCRLRRVNYGFAVLGMLFRRGHQPDAVTFNTLIKGLTLVGEINDAVGLFKKLWDDELSNEVTYHTMVDGLCKARHTQEALELIVLLENEERCKPTVQAYTSVIHGLCKDENVDEALQLFSVMADKGISPNIVTYTSMIRGLCSSNRWNEVDDMLNEMVTNEVYPDVITYNTLVDALCKEGKVEAAEQLLENMKQVGVQPNIVTYTALMHGYCLHRQMDKARNVFDLARNSGLKPDIISYNSLMNGYSRMGQVGDASHLFIKVHAEGLEPNVVSYNTMLHALFREGRLEEGLNLFEQMEVAPHLSHDIITYNILLDGLCKANRIDEAFSVLCTMEDKGILPNIVSYSTLIQGLCNNNRIRQAKMLFNKLSSIGLQPNVVTYTILIGALCDEGKTKEAKDLFLGMENNGVLPNSVTYNVFIRGLVRRNRMHDASLFLEDMMMRGFTLNPTTSSAVLQHLRDARRTLALVR